MKRKVIMLVSAAALLAAATAIGGSMAWLTGHDEVKNTFTVGNVTVATEEVWDAADGQDIVPGDPITKKPYTKNIGSAPCYVRMQIVVSPDKIPNPHGQGGTVDYLTIDGIDGTHWVKQGDYYYYVGTGVGVTGGTRGVLPVAQETEKLFQSVTLLPTALEEEVDGFTVDVYTEAIQSENLTAPTGDTAAFVTWLAGQFDTYGPNPS